MNYKPILEGLLFIVGEEGLTIDEMVEILEIENEEVNKVIEELKNDYENSDRGLDLVILGNKYKLVTKVKYKDYYKRYYKHC